MSEPPPDTPPSALDETEDVQYCYGHPDTPTKLRCSRCDRPICGRCAIPASVGQHCPECVAEARRTTRKARSAMRAKAPVTMAILAVNVGVFVLQILSGGGRGVDDLTRLFALFPPAINDGEWWRLFTPMVLHANTIHIFFNSYVLFIYGPEVEGVYGSRRYLIIYVLSGAMGSIFSYSFGPCVVLGVGASGAIFGVVGALIVFLYRRRDSALARHFLRGVTIFVVANLVLGELLPGIDNFAHLGGLVGGAALGLGLEQTRRAEPSPALEIITIAAVAGAGLLLLAWRTANFSCAF